MKMVGFWPYAVKEVVSGLVVKALDCGVGDHRFESHLLLPREGFSPGFSPGISTGEDLI